MSGNAQYTIYKKQLIEHFYCGEKLNSSLIRFFFIWIIFQSFHVKALLVDMAYSKKRTWVRFFKTQV